MEKTINVDIEVLYFWYDHLILRENGDAQKVTDIINNGDYEAFMRYYHTYNTKYYSKDGDKILFFPPTAALFYQDQLIGEIDILNPLGFSMITYNEYECG